MHYEITLPADYDMGIIRTRVATRGSALDAFPGLGLKAYCVRERGVDGSPVNQYSPFYLWRTAEGMNSFLWGPGFRGLSTDFGRPTVQHWVGLAYGAGGAYDADPGSGAPTAATKRVEHVPADHDPTEAIDRALADLEQRTAHPDVYATAVAMDPRHWQLVHFTLWRDTPDATPGVVSEDHVRYRVLHLSRPELDDLTAGRHW
ncbi:DUF4865 family protein [Saccharothrix hoggarensis]|uniref:DUF4865 family protein n=1 Tax=Saccharothrix hoggarensis TaxID=913853 RepID=A0ABW3R425_9PSEU